MSSQTEAHGCPGGRVRGQASGGLVRGQASGGLVRGQVSRGAGLRSPACETHPRSDLHSPCPRDRPLGVQVLGPHVLAET